MENKYLNQLNTTINYHEYLKKIEEERSKILEVIENSMDECNHELLITFGQVETYRCFGVGEKFYCPFCGKKIIKYLSMQSNTFDEKRVCVNLNGLNISSDKIKIIFLKIQRQLQEYLKNNSKSNLEDIKEYIYSIDINELIPKVKKYI